MLISRRMVMLVAVTAIAAMAFSLPLLVVFFGATSEIFMRFNTMEAALLGYAQHPLLGVGLRHSLVRTDKVNAVRSEIPAVTHIDQSARLQTVHRESNPRYHALITAFKARTGCPVLVNTSFNVRGEPIACMQEDAFRCFMGTEIEVLAVGHCLLRKERQDPALKLDYRNVLDPD
ncbi:MAG TPA: carbamoyltransferase C-terminal domain-containing protein [Candidatus Binataceae bacterium]|nr:carbamoyltransferase C-terminal domain-containing protein [Candidatus Binataceae bacterium]